MPLGLAKNLLPGLAVRKPRPELCRIADETIMRTALDYSPLVERAGAGHLFVDLAGTCRLHGVPEDATQRMRRRIMDETGLNPTLALSSTKTSSKVATRVFRPAGFVALSREEEVPLVRRQSVSLLPGVGPALFSRFRLLDIEDIGNLADLGPEEALAIGSRGPYLVARARGMDNSPVNPEAPERRSVRADILFEPDTTDPEALRLRLNEGIAELGFELRKAGSGARRATVRVGYTDGSSDEATARSARLLVRDDELASLALAALSRARTRRVRIRRLGLQLSAIGSAGPELDLFEPREIRTARLQTALDRVRRRHGAQALVPCALYALARSPEKRAKAALPQP
jgi:DNA polymerase-4